MDVDDIDLKLLGNCSEIALKLLWKSAAFRGCLMSVKRREPLPKPGRFQPNLKNLNTTANLLIFLVNYWFKWTNQVTQRSHRGHTEVVAGRSEVVYPSEFIAEMHQLYGWLIRWQLTYLRPSTCHPAAVAIGHERNGLFTLTNVGYCTSDANHAARKMNEIARKSSWRPTTRRLRAFTVPVIYLNI